ncbi:hypothetical protein ENBRE01_2919, partial [Enteropsectra breve]
MRRYSKEEIEEIKAILEAGGCPSSWSKAKKQAFKRKVEGMEIEGGRLLVLDEGRKLEILAVSEQAEIESKIAAFHLPNHHGILVTYEHIKNNYVGITRKMVAEYVQRCESCQRHQPLKRTAAICPIISKFPWERIQIDCIDLRMHAEENDGYGWILNVIDVYSKFMFAFAMKRKEAAEVRQCLKALFDCEGPPKKLQSDNGKEFVNAKIKEFCAGLSVKMIHGRPRHPQNQGQIERANQTLIRSLSKHLCDKASKRWIDELSTAVYHYNIA